MTNVDLRNRLGLARTFLFVPADRPERLHRALSSGADAVIVDLEDAVAEDAKANARHQLSERFAGLCARERSSILVRINAAGTTWHADDRVLIRRLGLQGLGGVVLPKAEQAGVITELATEVGSDLVIVPIIETAYGLASLDAVCSCPQVLRIAFGNLDFQADLGMCCGDDERALAPARLAIVVASRLAALFPPIDGVTTQWSDSHKVIDDSKLARRGGFGGKLCIHPAQVPIVNEAFAPSDEELEWAHKVVAAADKNPSGGAIKIEGRMVDAPVIKLAERILGRASFDRTRLAASGPIPPASGLRRSPP